jgi:hypothetical protein
MERNENQYIGNNVVYIFDMNFELVILIVNSKYLCCVFVWKKYQCWMETSLRWKVI